MRTINESRHTELRSQIHAYMVVGCLDITLFLKIAVLWIFVSCSLVGTEKNFQVSTVYLSSIYGHKSGNLQSFKLYSSILWQHGRPLLVDKVIKYVQIICYQSQWYRVKCSKAGFPFKLCIIHVKHWTIQKFLSIFTKCSQMSIIFLLRPVAIRL